MGIHIYLFLLYQITWGSFIGAAPLDANVSMKQTIFKDLLSIKNSSVIKSIWEQEPVTLCDREKPPERMLDNKQFMQFYFVPYLCVILYDASLRYLDLNTSKFNTEIDSGNAQEIIKHFSPTNFCEVMKDNKWFTTLEDNKLWVSHFNSDMKNKDLCERYCVTDIVNPICAYALWLDMSIKFVKHETLHPLNPQESHPSQNVLNPPKKNHVSALVGTQPQDNNAQISPAVSTTMNGNAVNRKKPNVSAERQISNVATARQHSDMPVTAHLLPGREEIPGQSPRENVPNTVSDLDQTNVRKPATNRIPTGARSGNSQQLNTLATSNGASLSVLGNSLVPGRTSEYSGQKNVQNVLSHDPNEEVRHIENPEKIDDSSKPEDRKNSPKQSQSEKPTEAGQLENTKQTGITSSANSEQGTVQSVSEITHIVSSPPEIQGEYNTERQVQMSGDLRPNANLKESSETLQRGQGVASNVVLPEDSPKPSDPEAPKKPVSSEDVDKVRVNSPDPENNTKEATGNTNGETTETKPAVDLIAKSEPEAANHAFEGDGRAMSGEPDDRGEPDDHEEQNAMDDVAVDSQVENGDALGDHGGDQTQDRDEGIDGEPEFPSESPRYNEADDELSKPDGSTKLSNNNKDYPGGSDEEENSPGEQARIPLSEVGGYTHDRFVDAEDSHFFAYFMTMIVLCIIGYLIFHNKQKILALALEGRSRKGTRRRPSTSGYRKLDSNLEEAVTSSCTGSSVTHVIY